MWIMCIIADDMIFSGLVSNVYINCITLYLNMEIGTMWQCALVSCTPSIDYIPALDQLMAWHRLGDKPLPEHWWLDYPCKYASLGLDESMGWPVLRGLVLSPIRSGLCVFADRPHQTDLKFRQPTHYWSPQAWLPFLHALLNSAISCPLFEWAFPPIYRHIADQMELKCSGWTHYGAPQTFN